MKSKNINGSEDEFRSRTWGKVLAILRESVVTDHDRYLEPLIQIVGSFIEDGRGAKYYASQSHFRLGISNYPFRGVNQDPYVLVTARQNGILECEFVTPSEAGEVVRQRDLCTPGTFSTVVNNY